jgi:2-polyprenyl-3-methyl-5-hydroxy-6-metoxy-1,4-benzoquinol methylase
LTDQSVQIKELAAIGLHKKVLEIVRQLPLGKALDLGAGEGAFSKNLKDLMFDVTACDVEPSIFQPNDIPFVKGDFNVSIPLVDSYFDLVVFIEVLEHLKNPWKAIFEINRVLKPGGYLILTTPNVGTIYQRLYYLFHSRFDGFGYPTIRNPLEHLHPFSLSELKMMMNETGFEFDDFIFDRPFRFKKYLPTNKWTGLTTIVKARKKNK